jgi:hypothetical protein
MKNPTLHGRQSGLEEIPSRTKAPPTPLITFSPIWTQGRLWAPNPGNRHALLLLKRVTATRVSFARAYSGWRASGAREESELGEGRALLRWLQKYKLSIAWQEKDFQLNPLFCCPDSPFHFENDEMAQGLSFAIKPVSVSGRKVKLYVEDEDMLSLIGISHGDSKDFIELVMQYVSLRFEWEKWRSPAPPFKDWIISQGLRPSFSQGQVGFHPILTTP